MKRTLSALALAASALLASAPASSAIVVGFTPATNHVAIGDSVNIQMKISGLGDEILSGFDFNAIWNASIATGNFVTLFCPVLGAGSLCGFDTAVDGNVGANGTSVLLDDDLAAVQPDSLVIAEFSLKGAADGVTALTLGPDPDLERNFVGRDFATLDVRIDPACIAVGTGSCEVNVPEPSTYALAAVALLAGGLARRVRRPSAPSTGHPAA